MQNTSIRTIHFRYRHFAIYSRPCRCIPFALFWLDYRSPSAISFTIFPFTSQHCRWSRYQHCLFATRWHTIRCFLKNPTCWLVGTQYKNLGRLPWTSIVSGRLDKCQPQSWHYQATDSERTWRRIHRRDPWYQNSWRTLAQRHCLREVGSCSCRQSGSKIGRHIPERQRLPNLRHISLFLCFCLPLQEEWQGASIDIKAAHKRMLIREDERGSLLFKFKDRILAYRSAHFGAKTVLLLSAWHWGRVSGALLRLLHVFLYFRHAAWVYVDDFFFLFPRSTSTIQFAIAIIFLRMIGAPLSCKKLEFDSSIEWNGWSIQPAVKTAQLPPCKHNKIMLLIDTLLQTPCRKNLEKSSAYYYGPLRWCITFVSGSLHSIVISTLIPATNYSIPPTKWNQFLTILNEGATITIKTIFISLLVLRSSNLDIPPLLPNPSFPRTYLSNVMSGSNSGP